MMAKTERRCCDCGCFTPVGRGIEGICGKGHGIFKQVPGGLPLAYQCFNATACAEFIEKREEKIKRQIDRMAYEGGIIRDENMVILTHNKCVDKINEIIDVFNAQDVDVTKDNDNVININDEVTVELTDYGQKVALQHYQKSNVSLLLIYRHVRDDIYRFPLWELMNIFGKQTYMGANQVFVHNTILFAEDERTKADSFVDAIKNMGWSVEDLKAATEILKRK